MVNKKLNFAAIDIGSNAVRLLIKSVAVGASPAEMTKALLVRIPLRLGEEVFARGSVSASKEKRLLRTIKAFRLLMKVYDVTAYRACATSAIRVIWSARCVSTDSRYSAMPLRRAQRRLPHRSSSQAKVSFASNSDPTSGSSPP